MCPALGAGHSFVAAAEGSVVTSVLFPDAAGIASDCPCVVYGVWVGKSNILDA